jgi:hypothetical protein
VDPYRLVDVSVLPMAATPGRPQIQARDGTALVADAVEMEIAAVTAKVEARVKDTAPEYWRRSRDLIERTGSDAALGKQWSALLLHDDVLRGYVMRVGELGVMKPATRQETLILDAPHRAKELEGQIKPTSMSTQQAADLRAV